MTVNEQTASLPLASRAVHCTVVVPMGKILIPTAASKSPSATGPSHRSRLRKGYGREQSDAARNHDVRWAGDRRRGVITDANSSLMLSKPAAMFEAVPLNPSIVPAPVCDDVRRSGELPPVNRVCSGVAIDPA